MTPIEWEQVMEMLKTLSQSWDVRGFKGESRLDQMIVTLTLEKKE